MDLAGTSRADCLLTLPSIASSTGFASPNHRHGGCSRNKILLTIVTAFPAAWEVSAMIDVGDVNDG